MNFAIKLKNAKGMDMEEIISFEDLGLDEATLNSVKAKGFEQPSPIQALAIPRLLNGDANMIAKARTGTGKTAAFGIPLVQNIRSDNGNVQALVLTPTRELALQVSKEIESLACTKFPRITSVYGGAGMVEQLRKLKHGTEIVVGTPGRVQDHLERGSLKIDKIDYFILDEADEMLDMGFIDDIEAIFAQANPNSRVLLFSATMPSEILKIASRFMGDYEIIEEEARPEEPVLTEQYYWLVRENEKINALVRLIDIAPDFYGLIFTQTKADADMVCKALDDKGYAAVALHGDIPQTQREKILLRFRNKKTRILVATDVAARGIDVTGLSHVVNYAMPFDGPTYIHRIGRTGRAGAKGKAYTLVRPEERRKLRYLISVSSGNLKEEKIPSVNEVLKVKKARLFEETAKSLGLLKEKEEIENSENATNILTQNQIEKIEQFKNGENLSTNSSEIEKSGELGNLGNLNNFEKLGESAERFEQIENIENAQNLAAQKDEPLIVKSASKDFVDFANKLCQNNDPMAVLAAVLEENFGQQLNPKRYGEVSQIGSSNTNVKQIRLYIGLGRRDGMGRAEIARFFSDLLRIPGRLVDRIEVTENFSLASLPPDLAMRALDMAKRDKSLPHLHIDTKSNDDGFTKKRERSGKRFGRERDFDRRFEERENKGKRGLSYGGRGKGRDNFEKRERRSPKGKGQNPEMMPLQYRTSNASLYKKSDKY